MTEAAKSNSEAAIATTSATASANASATDSAAVATKGKSSPLENRPNSTVAAGPAPLRRKRKRVEREKLTVGRTSLFRGHSLALRPELKPLSTSKLPPSALLQKLQQFLPKMQAANIKLKHRMQAGASPAEVDIEHISDEDAPHIEFNIAMLNSDESDEEEPLVTPTLVSMGRSDKSNNQSQ